MEVWRVASTWPEQLARSIAAAYSLGSPGRISSALARKSL
jgi:hypothetical protein